MPKTHKPRAGSLQFWPRVRAAKLLPSVNWVALEKKHLQYQKRLLGFIGYKAGMLRALVRDLTPNSLTKNKQITIPITLIECPPMKLLSVRFYKNNNVVFDILADDLDKELKRKLKLPREKGKKKATDEFMKIVGEKEKKFDDIKIIVYSLVKKSRLKKTPDIIEMGISGNLNDKIDFVKSCFKKELNILDFFNKKQLLDIHAVTKGHGFVGPIKRFGFGLKQSKSEKGRRRPGSLGPWTPSRVTFRAPLAGQHGFFTRIQYNSQIIDIGSAEKIKMELPHYGTIKTTYVALKGSVQGPAKRQIMLTLSLRETKKAAKENFELLNFLK